jgi:hypothetical protein
MKKRYNYYLARNLIVITGILFLIQLIFEFIGNRKPDFEWVIYVCGAAFLLSLIYSLILIILNTRISKEDLKENIIRDDYYYIPCIQCYYYNRGRMCYNPKSIKSKDIVTGEYCYNDCEYMRDNLCGKEAKLFKTRKLWQKLFKE